MNRFPRSDTGKERSNVTVRGITYYQAYDLQKIGDMSKRRIFILAENEIGETIFALPGGGRATFLELEKLVGGT